MDPSKTLVIACATVIEEMQPLLPSGLQTQTLDFGLHVYPDRLRDSLQAAVDAVSGQYETILLGYGLCSNAVVGLRATGCRLVIPRVDDCIAIFLGSRASYNLQCRAEPGTYYLTKGWIEAGDTPFSEYEDHVQRFGEETADYIFEQMMGHYTRLALINTGQYELEKYRAYTRDTAGRFGLRYEEIDGSDALVRRLLFGPWGDDFVVLEAGETFRLDQFVQQ